LGFPFNISATAETSDFKFGIQLEFAKAHRKITPEEKWAWTSTRDLPEFGFPSILLRWVKLAIYNSACSWVSLRRIIKSNEKVGVTVGWGAPQYLGVIFNISVITEASDFKFGIQLGFAKSNYKTTPKDKSGHGPPEKFRKNGVPLLHFCNDETSDFKSGTQLECAN